MCQQFSTLYSLVCLKKYTDLLLHCLEHWCRILVSSPYLCAHDNVLFISEECLPTEANVSLSEHVFLLTSWSVNIKPSRHGIIIDLIILQLQSGMFLSKFSIAYKV